MRPWVHPVMSCAEAKAHERALFGDDAAAEWAAMQRAGRAVAEAVAREMEETGGWDGRDGRLLVLAGKGHNGGDALLAAAGLLRRAPASRARVVFWPAADGALRPHCAAALRHLSAVAGTRVEIRRWTGDPALVGGRWEAVLDGLFGLSFRPPLPAGAAALVGAVNEHPDIGWRFAVDVPSGVGDGGPEAGALRADVSLATGIVKTPLVQDAWRAWTGRLRYLDLGFFGEGAEEGGGATRADRPADGVLGPGVLARLAGPRRADTDKRSHGHLFVLGGSRGLPGAVLLAVRAALRSGVGLVSAFVPASLQPAFAAAAPEAMWVPWPETPEGGLGLDGRDGLLARLDRASAILAGPGLGREAETQAMLQILAEDTAGMPWVLDADALQSGPWAALRGGPLVLTPHAGEWARLCAGRDPEEAFRALRGAREDAGVVVLKGPVTRVAAGGRIDVSPWGGPVLARGGSGDVLAGLTAGLLARWPGEPAQAARAAVAWHGRAADLLARRRGSVAVTALDLVAMLPEALREAGRPGRPVGEDEPEGWGGAA